MPLGSPRTKKFQIGTAEVRIGPLTSAGKLKQADSVGLLDTVTVEVSQESVDLLGGFPRVPVDTAITAQNASLTATLREYSRRNIQTQLGTGVPATQPADVASEVVDATTAGSTSVTVITGDGANFAADDVVIIFPDGTPEKVTLSKVASVSTDTLTLDSDLPTLFDYDGTADTIHIFKALPVAVGDVEQTEYFACQILQRENSTGRPVGFHFWKSAINTGMSFANNPDDFSSTEFGLKFLQPAASEYAAGASLEHLADLIPTYPTGMFYAGGDS
jgi:hypothetical protein